MGGQPLGRCTFAGCRHFLPQADTRTGVKTRPGSQLHAHQIGLRLVAAAELQSEQLCPVTGHRLTQLPQPQHAAEQIGTDAGRGIFAHALSGVFTQGVRYFMPHDGGHFMVGKFELLQNAAVKRNFAARHAKRIDLLAADQVHLPAPLLSTRVPAHGMRDDFLGNGAQPP